MASSFAAKMAITMAKDKAGDAVGMVHRSRPSAPTIQWENFNFPCKREPFNIIHFDLQELKTITERGFFAVRRVLAWHYATLAIVLFHWINALIISLGTSNSAIYGGVNVVYATFNVIIALVGCHFVLYYCYHGIAESVYWERRRGMVVMAVLLVLSLVQAFVAMGGTNGFGTYGTDRMAAARSLGLGIVGYWSAMIAIESIVWLGVAAWGGYTFFKLLQY